MDFVEANGIGLRYELSGKGERTLVLVHEMGGSLESWDDVVPRFTGSRRVLRYDTRGAGLSQKARGELTLDTMADDIAALLDTLDITGKVAIAARRARRGDRASFRRPISRTHQRRRGRQPGHRHHAGTPRPRARTRCQNRGQRHGLRGRGFHVERLCAGASRRHQALRAIPRAMARQRSRKLCGDLANAGERGHAGRTEPAELSGARDRRQPRSGAPGSGGGRRSPNPSPARATSRSAPATTWRCRRPI